MRVGSYLQVHWDEAQRHEAWWLGDGHNDWRKRATPCTVYESLPGSRFALLHPDLKAVVEGEGAAPGLVLAAKRIPAGKEEVEAVADVVVVAAGEEWHVVDA